MDHRIDIGQRATYRAGGSDITDEQLHAAVEIVRRMAFGAVNLRVEIVERFHIVIVLKQQGGAMRRNEAGAASDQYFLGHSARQVVVCFSRPTNRLARTKVQTF